MLPVAMATGAASGAYAPETRSERQQQLSFAETRQLTIQGGVYEHQGMASIYRHHGSAAT